MADVAPAARAATEGPAGTIHGLLAAQAARAPDAVALVTPGRDPLTYAGLLARVDEAAGALRGFGLGRGDRVALALADGVAMTVALLAVTAVATAAPLDPALTAAELDAYLGAVRPRLLIAETGLETPARTVAAARGVQVAAWTPAPGREPGRFSLTGPHPAGRRHLGSPRPDDIAAIVMTSGTTGRPKLIPLTHANLMASAAYRARASRLTDADRGFNGVPVHYLPFLTHTLETLVVGASVVCPPCFRPSSFFAWLDEGRPTYFGAGPTILQILVDRAPAHRETIARSRLRFVRTGMAPLPPSLRAELEATFGVPVMESYALNEAASTGAITPLPPHPRKPGSVGRSIGPELAILDAAGARLPPGEAGEIAVRGASVMAGYLDDPAANAAAFTSDGWLRTGDLGRLDADGDLFVTGRLKELINRGGEKVGPYEVEAALLTHPAVAQAVAFAMPDERLGEEIAAAVVLRPGHAASEADLRRFAAVRLAAYKVPRRVVLVDELPKGSAGKVKRLGLASALGLVAGSPHMPTSRPGFVAPRTPVEEMVAAFWAEVLGLAEVGVDDDFLELGGDSVLASLVAARLSRALRLEISVATFFEAPTVAAMALAVEDLLLGDAERQLVDEVGSNAV